MVDVFIELDRKNTNHGSILKEYYARYLTDIRKNSQSTVKHYFDALNNISRRLKEKSLVRENIYEVADIDTYFNLGIFFIAIWILYKQMNAVEECTVLV